MSEHLEAALDAQEALRAQIRAGQERGEAASQSVESLRVKLEAARREAEEGVEEASAPMIAAGPAMAAKWRAFVAERSAAERASAAGRPLQ